MFAHKTTYDTLTTDDLPEKGTREWYLLRRARREGRVKGLGRVRKFREVEKYKPTTVKQILADEMPRICESEYNFYFWNVGPQLCHYCDVELNKFNRTKDHVIPRAHGGSELGFSNLIPACKECNWAKADKKLIVFLLERQKQRKQG